jgi:GNAT superfamily N-acetyltransferase
LFRKLLSDSFDDPENEGLLVANSEDTMAFFDELFKSAVFVLFVADKGMILVSETQSPATFKMGKLASVMAAYVTPDAKDQGIEKALFAEAKDRVESLGYNGLIFATPSVGTWQATAEEVGFEPFMLHMSLEL